MRRFAWVTVNFRQERFLSAWLASIPRGEGSALDEIFVVDNSDTLREFSGGAIVLSPKANLGYFGGFNYCLDQISVMNYDAVVFCNPDVVFADNFRVMLERALCEVSAMAYAPRITLLSGVEQNPAMIGAVGVLRRLYYCALFSCFPVFGALSKLSALVRGWRRRREAPPGPVPIYLAHGACFVLTPAFFEKYARLDQRVFMWGEEVFLRHQVASAGGEIWFVPSLHLVHHEHSATGYVSSRERFDLMRRSYLIYRDLF